MSFKYSLKLTISIVQHSSLNHWEAFTGVLLALVRLKYLGVYCKCFRAQICDSLESFKGLRLTGSGAFTGHVLTRDHLKGYFINRIHSTGLFYSVQCSSSIVRGAFIGHRFTEELFFLQSLFGPYSIADKSLQVFDQLQSFYNNSTVGRAFTSLVQT